MQRSLLFDLQSYPWWVLRFQLDDYLLLVYQLLMNLHRLFDLSRFRFLRLQYHFRIQFLVFQLKSVIGSEKTQMKNWEKKKKKIKYWISKLICIVNTSYTWKFSRINVFFFQFYFCFFFHHNKCSCIFP